MKQKIITTFVVVMIVSGVAVGQTSAVIEDFENQVPETSAPPFSINTTEPYQGDRSMDILGDGAGGDSGYYFNRSLTDTTPERASFWIRGYSNDYTGTITLGRETTGDNGPSISLTDTSGIRIEDSFIEPGMKISKDEWRQIIFKNINWSDNTYDLELRNESGTIDEYKGATFENNVNSAGNISYYSGSIGSDFRATVDYITVNTEPTDNTKSSLEIEIDEWQPFNSEQEYTVVLNETNTTSGNVNRTDVTKDSNVTIYNITNTSSFSEPIATVNNSSDTIVSYNQTGQVSVNATYNGQELDNATNLTVGKRNLTNIGIMPPGQYINSFLEVDETTGGHNIGSATQWLIFIIIVMAAFGRSFDNDWAGIGIGLLTAIMLWVVNFVNLGMILSITFFAIFVGTLKMRINRGNNGGDVNVNVESNEQFNQ